jgi:ferric-dicitrate binding protein FerR (iron transport regulator)
MDRNKDLDELRSDDAFAELLGKASPRPAPPAMDEALIRAAVHAEWQQVAGGNVRRRHITSFALAASVLLAVFATLNLLRDPVSDIRNQQLATIEKQFGEISVNSRIANADEIMSIEGGAFVATGSASGLALGWHDGGSLRIDENSMVVFEAVDQIYLKNGRVYFDSQEGPLSSQPAKTGAVELSIRTDHGVIRHLGTQYMTRVGADELVISVREGIVSIDGNIIARASAGQKFAISASGSLTINDTNGVDDWEWVEKSTPAVNLNGRFVAEALAWVSRESGRTVSYASDAAEMVANEAQLRGNMKLPPTRALDIFMMTVDLNARIEGDVIVVSED